MLLQVNILKARGDLVRQQAANRTASKQTGNSSSRQQYNDNGHCCKRPFVIRKSLQLLLDEASCLRMVKRNKTGSNHHTEQQKTPALQRKRAEQGDRRLRLRFRRLYNHSNLVGIGRQLAKNGH
ncbi:hypothetical protein D3C78_1641610 [compost metagenome]